MALTFTTVSTVTLDETPGVQNLAATPSPSGDSDDNDILASRLPQTFVTRLGQVASSSPANNALSGYVGGADAGSNAFTVSAGTGGVITDVSFVGPTGAPLEGLDSGLLTLGDTKIFLYTDTNNNILLGRVGNENGLLEDTANPNGTVAFAAYIDETVSGGSITGGKIWLVSFQALKHLDPNNADDALNLLNKVFIGASQDVEFSLAGAPSGQNLFLMFTKANPNVDVDGRITDVSIVATGKDPLNQSDGGNISSGDTINTSQAGGPTTFGTNSQMITEQEGIRFTFVTGARQNVTIPNLDQNEADLESNIDFTAFFGSRAAEFDVVQLQSGKSAQVRISTFSSTYANGVGDPHANESGAGFIDGYADDTPIGISSVKVINTVTNAVVAAATGTTTTPVNGIVFTFSGSSVLVTGVKADQTIQYTTTADHNRVLVENGAALNASGNNHADFDIGGFKVVQTAVDKVEIGSKMVFEDDGPDAVVFNATADTLVLDETRPVGTETDGDSAPAGLDTVTANFADNFAAVTNYGADGAGTTVYTLALTGTGVGTGLYSLDATDTSSGDGDGIGQGAEILLNQSGNTVTGSAGQTSYFTIGINNATGVVTFTQSNNIWHASTASDDDSATLTTSTADLLRVVQTVTDRDGDADAVSINLGAGVFSIEDDGPNAVVFNATADTLVLDETRPVGTETDGDSAPAGLDTVTANFADNFGAVINYGTDGAGSAGYTLVLTGTDVASGLYALDATDTSAGDGDGIGQGAQILLNQSGNTVTGSAGQTSYFTIGIDNATGVVTFTQSNNIWHASTASDDDSATLTTSAADLLRVVQTVTDRDGDTDTAAINLGAGVFSIEDDGPDAVVFNATADTLVLDETRPVGTETDGDSAPAGLDTVTANFADNFAAVTSYGTDGAGSTGYTLALTGTAVGSGLYALDAADNSDADGDGIGQGAEILLNQSGNTVTGSAGQTNYFTIGIDNATGVVTFTQSNNIWHASTASDDDSATLTTSAADLLRVVQTVTDRDGDTDTAAINLGAGVFSIEDDGPTVTTSPVKDTDPTLGTTQWTYSGAFAYTTGTDRNGPVYSSTNSDFAALVLSGLANDAAIGSPSVTWFSESSTLATFNLAFNYDHDHNGTATQPVTGQLVFDKSNNTYTVTLDALEVQQDVTLSGGTGYQTYDIGGTTPSSGPSPVATGKLGEGFYLQITGFESPLNAGGNTAFAVGELVSGAIAPVTLSSTALGVSGNTIQAGEAANLKFFATDPKGSQSATDFTYADDFYIKFDGIETESDDLILVLNLVDGSDSSVTTTRAIYVDQGDIYESDTVNTGLVGTKYQAIVATLDNNDGLLIVESNDYNIDTGDNWVLRGLQILSNDAGLTGDAINLNRAVGSSGGSSTAAVTVSGLIGPGNTIQEDTSTNPLKIIDAGFSTTTTTPPSLDLTVDFKVVDADGDTTAVQTIEIDYPVQEVTLMGMSVM
jgi:hypothetical protein